MKKKKKYHACFAYFVYMYHVYRFSHLYDFLQFSQEANSIIKREKLGLLNCYIYACYGILIHSLF